MNIGIIGAGGWGTALATVLAANNHTITLWTHEKSVSDDIKIQNVTQLMQNNCNELREVERPSPVTLDGHGEKPRHFLTEDTEEPL